MLFRVGIRIEHVGLCVAARRPEARHVLEAFKATDMGRACEMITPETATARIPTLRQQSIVGALWSPHELRVESREAVPRLANWLEKTAGLVHTWYHKHHVLNEPPPIMQARLVLANATRVVLANALAVLGLSAPERM